jgi:hypothetical protein
VSYIGLGYRTATGAKDTTGNNSGNWTVTFDTAALNVKVPYFEIYHIAVKGAAGSTFTVYKNLGWWDSNNYGQLNGWDPNEPMQCNPSDTVYFYYSDATTDNTPPSVTIWLRYDPDLAPNKGMVIT